LVQISLNDKDITNIIKYPKNIQLIINYK